MLSKKHVTDSELDLDLEAISHGDFRDVPEGHVTFFLVVFHFCFWSALWWWSKPSRGPRDELALKLSCKVFTWRKKKTNKQTTNKLTSSRAFGERCQRPTIHVKITLFVFFSSEDEEFVSSFITSRSEKQLVQQLKRSLLSTKNYSDIVVNSVKKVKLLKCKKCYHRWWKCYLMHCTSVLLSLQTILSNPVITWRTCGDHEICLKV